MSYTCFHERMVGIPFEASTAKLTSELVPEKRFRLVPRVCVKGLLNRPSVVFESAVGQRTAYSLYNQPVLQAELASLLASFRIRV